MSGEEPGYTPPDHRTTAEFPAPGRPAAPEADSTVVDGDLIDPEATIQDVEPEATIQDADPELSPGVTFQDPPESLDDAGVPEDRSSVTISDMPVQPKMPPAQEPIEDEAAEETEAEQAVLHEEAPWTAQFGAEAARPMADPDAGTPVYTPPPPSPEATIPPPVASPSGGMTTAGPSGTRRPLLFVAAIGAVVVVAAAVAAVLLLSGGSEKKGEAKPPPSSAAPAPATQAPIASGEPSPRGAPAPPAASPAPSGGAVGEPSEPPAPTAPIGPVRKGDGITYQLVERSEGYFEGQLVITNRTDRPMRTWRLTFRVPGAKVRSIWGARLVSGGANPEIVNLAGAPAIPPGETWDVRFGAAGATSIPQGCELNGEPCGF